MISAEYELKLQVHDHICDGCSVIIEEACDEEHNGAAIEEFCEQCAKPEDDTHTEETTDTSSDEVTDEDQ